MAGKARVHELAKELGVESKVVLAKLKELGEFVKSASSTVEAPVARRLREVFVPPSQSSSSASAPTIPSKAAPKPCAERAASRIGRLGASAQTSDVTAKMLVPMTSSRRRPK